jgi:hypothetical protein
VSDATRTVHAGLPDPVEGDPWRCCAWPAAGMLTPYRRMGQIAEINSSNAIATRRLAGPSTASS